MADQEQFKLALEIRNMEIRLFWERSNFYLALNTAVAIGFFSLESESYRLPLACLALFASALWAMVNLGSKFWQARWEEKLRQVEEGLENKPNFFVEDYDEIKKQVRRNLERQARSWLGRKCVKLILTKPSVSTTAIYLSFGFCLLWLFFISLSLWGIANGGNAPS